MTTVTEEDLDRFALYVRNTMFEDASAREIPEDLRDAWPLITPEYRFQHSVHVRRFIDILQAGEGGDLGVMRSAAIFHDISHFRTDYSCHGPVSARMTRAYLTAQGYPGGFRRESLPDHRGP